MYKNKKIILFAFASLDLKKSLLRLKKQATISKYYTEIKILTPNDFDNKMKIKIQNLFSNKKKRGYGYWCWKPYFLLEIISKIDYGDIIHYMDIGCHIKKTTSNRFYEYLDLLIDSDKWLLAFQYHKKGIKFSDDIKFPKREEFKYTKSDIFNYFQCLHNKEITHTPQFWSGSFFIKKDPKSEVFLEQWNNVFNENFHLIDDTPSKAPNFNGFLENRHDQSIFSILCKKALIKSLSAYECEWGEKNNQRTWVHNQDNPILAKRDLEYNIFRKFINRQIKNFKRKKGLLFKN